VLSYIECCYRVAIST